MSPELCPRNYGIFVKIGLTAKTVYARSANTAMSEERLPLTERKAQTRTTAADAHVNLSIIPSIDFDQMANMSNKTIVPARVNQSLRNRLNPAKIGSGKMKSSVFNAGWNFIRMGFCLLSAWQLRLTGTLQRKLAGRKERELRCHVQQPPYSSPPPPQSDFPRNLHRRTGTRNSVSPLNHHNTCERTSALSYITPHPVSHRHERKVRTPRAHPVQLPRPQGQAPARQPASRAGGSARADRCVTCHFLSAIG